MPAAPIIIGVAAASGAAAAIGTAIVGGTILAGAATAIGTAVIAGTITAVQGGDAGDILKSAVLSGVGAQVGSIVSSAVTSSVSAATGSTLGSGISAGTAGATGATIGAGSTGFVAGAGAGAILGAGVAPTVIGALAGNILGKSVEAAIVGAPIEQAILTGAAQTIPFAFSQSADFRALPTPVQNVLTASAQAAVTGQDVETAAVAALVQSTNIISKAVQQVPELNTVLKDNPTFARYVLDATNASLIAKLQGKDVSDAVIDSMARTTGKVIGEALKAQQQGTKLNDAQTKYRQANELQQQAQDKQLKLAILIEKNKNDVNNFNYYQNRYDYVYKDLYLKWDKIAERAENEAQRMRDDPFWVFYHGQFGRTIQTYETEAANARAQRDVFIPDVNEAVAGLNSSYDKLQSKGFFDEYNTLNKDFTKTNNQLTALVGELNKTSKDVADYSTKIFNDVFQQFDTDAQAEGWSDFSQKQYAIDTFSPVYKTTITPDMYKTIRDDINQTTYNANQNEKVATVNEARDAAILAGYNNFIFGNNLYTIGGQSIDLGDRLFTEAEDEFVFDGTKFKDQNQAVQAAYQAGFNTVKLPDNKVYNIPVDVQQKMQVARDFPGVFDGSKYKNITEASNAAAAVDENKFLWNGNVYQIKAPESAVNQIKNASTFNEAFALAQKNLGEGNVFEWRGQLYVNRTGEQDAVLPFNGNKYEDRGGAAYAAHLAGKNTFTWGGNTWQLPSNYASQISGALGQNPNQSAAETKRLLDANIRAASSNAIDASKINLAQTGIPVIDKVIGAISYNQGIGIEGVGNVLTNLSQAQALATGGSFENTLKNVGTVLQTFGERLQPEELAREGKRQSEAIAKEVERAGKIENPFEANAIIAKAIYNNLFGFWTDVGTEIGEEAPGLLVGATALVFGPMTATVKGASTLIASISAALNGAEIFGSAGGEEYRRLIAEGKTEQEARLNGIIMGAVNTAVGIPLEFVGDKALAGAFLDGARGGVQTAVKTVINPVSVNAATEWLEEFFQGVASRVVRGEEQNVSEDAARATYASAVGAGTSAGILTPNAINRAAQIGLDYFGRPVTFDEFINPPPPGGGGGGVTTPGGGPPPSGGGGGVDIEGPFPPGAGGASIDLSTLDFNVPIATLSDGSQITLGGLQLLLPSAGIDRSVINDISPDLRLSRNDAAIFTRQQTFDDQGRFIGYSFAPVKLKDSKPVFERYLIDIGDIPTITETEAKNLLQLEGRKNPTETEVQEVMDKARDENDRDIAKEIADPFTVSIEEVKEAARAAGYAITDEEAAKYVEERLETDVLAELGQRFDPLATTEQEVREMFEAQGYSPTREEIDRFIQSVPEAQIRGQLQTYVDPRMLYPSDVKALAAQEGYEISDARARELSGQKDKYASLDALRTEFDAGAVTLDEARQMFANTPYKPTDAEIAQFIASKPESQVQQDIQNYVDPRYLTLEEIKAAAKAEGYDISDEEAAALVGQRTKTSIEQTAENIMLMAVNRLPPDMRYDLNNDGKITSADAAAYVRNARDEAGGILPTPQEEAIAAFRKEINPKAVTEAEARAFFNELGYKPTQEELMQFIQSRSEAQVMEDISAYVDPRYVTLEEVKRVANEEGYAITDQEALSLTGQKSQQEILDALRTRADTLAVLGPEAQEFFAELNYTPTEEEIAQFVGSRPEADIRSELATYVDPRYVTLEEIKAAALAEGYDVTDEEAAALVGQKNQEEAIAEFRGEINPKAVIEAEAQAFFAEFGYAPTAEELSQFIVSRPEDQVMADIQTYINPRQVTREEAEAQFRNIQSEYQFTPEEIDQFIRAGIDVSQEGVLDEIAAYIDPRYITPEEVKSRYAELGFTTPLEEDITKFTGQTAQEGLEGRVQENLPTARLNYVSKQLADLQAEQALQKQTQDLNAKFAQDVQALINADPYIDIQTAIDQTIGKIDDPEQRKLIDPTAPPILGLAQEQAAKKATRQQKSEQLRKQGMDMVGLTLPTAESSTFEPHKMDMEPLYSGDPGDPFVSPLAPYLAKVEQQSYTGEQPPTPEQPTAEPKDLTDMKRREQGYFTYGQPSEIEQNMAAASDPFGYYTAAAMAGGMRAGGLVPPLMAAGGTTRYGKYAGGGLNLVPHTGKMRVDFRQGDAVTGEGDGQSDDIPAMLADGEFVIPADVVAALGNGSTKAGSDKLYDMMHSIRAEHRSADPKSLPPPSKSPLDYVSKRPKARKRKES